ncbi:MAG: ribulose-phosphate 3-epimerase [Armatimonadota bacterium]
MTKISVSILSADFSNLASEIKKINKSGADMIHFDIMDGYFVPNLTFGPMIIKTLRPLTKLFFDTHLMVERPMSIIDDCIKAGSQLITIHAEADTHIKKTLEYIKSKKIKTGLSINPGTSINKIKPYINLVDLILIMTVQPGFSAQKFKPEVLQKIHKTRELIDKSGKKILLEVDGGINNKTAPEGIKAGADILVSASYIFNSKDYKKAVENLKNK